MRRNRCSRSGRNHCSQSPEYATVAATEENQGFLRSFPFLTIAYMSCAVIFGHVLASWNPNILGVSGVN